MAGANGPDSFRQVNGMGTGVVIDPRGYVITNYHVVEDVQEILVTLHDGRQTTAELVAARIRSDLALIKVDIRDSLPIIPRGTSDDLMVGESVIAIGNAYGYVHTSTQGIISALHRDVPVNETQDYRDLIQISAGINPGNSGGPLLNIDGEMIGVNVAVRVGAQQIAFAIPIDQVIDIVTDMIEEHNESRLMTGIRTNGGPRDGDGISIADVSASSPAAREGLKPGDRVVRVGSQSVNDRLDYTLALLDSKPGQPLQIKIDRNGQTLDLALATTASATNVVAANDPKAKHNQRNGLERHRRSCEVGRRFNDASVELTHADQLPRRPLYHRRSTRVSSRRARDTARRRLAGHSRLADVEHE